MSRLHSTIRNWLEARSWAELQLEDLRAGRARVLRDGVDQTRNEILRLERTIDGLTHLLDYAAALDARARKRRRP